MTLSHARAAIVRELAFTDAYQTWSKEAQALEDRLVKAARGEDDPEAIGTELKERDLDFEEWEILYRLLLQVKLRVSLTGSDALESVRSRRPRCVSGSRLRCACSLGNPTVTRYNASSRGDAPHGAPPRAND